MLAASFNWRTEGPIIEKAEAGEGSLVLQHYHGGNNFAAVPLGPRLPRMPHLAWGGLEWQLWAETIATRLMTRSAAGCTESHILAVSIPVERRSPFAVLEKPESFLACGYLLAGLPPAAEPRTREPKSRLL